MPRSGPRPSVDSEIEPPQQAYLAPEPTDEEWPGNGINAPDLWPQLQVSKFDAAACEHRSSTVNRHSESSDNSSKGSSAPPAYRPDNTSGSRAALYNLPDPCEFGLNPEEKYDDQTSDARLSVSKHQGQTSTLHDALWSDGLELGGLLKKNDKVIIDSGLGSQAYGRNPNYVDYCVTPVRQKIDPADVAFNEVARMSHRQRRKAQGKQKEIQACVTCEYLSYSLKCLPHFICS